MSKQIRQTKPSDFHPVIPNITDESMKDRDPDIDIVKRMDEKNKLKRDVEINEKETNNSKNTQNSGKKEVRNSVGRSIIIGVLIIVITVLVILLIYQVYKMLTTDENPLEEPPLRNPSYKPKSCYTPPPPQSKTENHSPKVVDHVKRIPDHVRDMDENILSQFISKSKPASENINTSKEIEHSSMVEDITDPSMLSEDTRVSTIIDNAMQKDDTVSFNDEEIPTREDITIGLQNDMTHDIRERNTLFTIAEKNIPQEFEFGDDSDSVKSESEGCQFILIKGKNKGQVCGRSRSTVDRCQRHDGKIN
jgi:hypothetical protein